MPVTEAALRDALLTLAARRGRGKTFCPSEVARALASDWRPLMPQIRAIAGDLVREDALRATQKAQPVDPVAARGPIRLGLP